MRSLVFSTLFTAILAAGPVARAEPSPAAESAPSSAAPAAPAPAPARDARSAAPAAPAPAARPATPAAPAGRRLQHRVAVAGGLDSWFRPEVGFHGFVMVAYDLTGLPAGAHFGVDYNTDKLALTFDRVRFAGGRLEAGLRLEAEVFLTELLTDYFRQGRMDPARGFQASRVELEAALQANLPKHNYLRLTLGGRKWFFRRAGAVGADGSTHPQLDLPPDLWELRARLHYTFWWLRDDPSLRERHRPFPRVRGVAFGVEGGADVRDRTGPWGARSPASFDPVDPRNDPGRVVGILRQWLRAGWQLYPRLRTQLYQTASWGFGEDDLTRVRIGGMNPYHRPLAGTAWSFFISDRYLQLQWSWHVRIFQALEVGLLADGLAVADPDRIGQNGDVGFHAGLGLFADLRFGAWQVDVRLGWSPTARWQGPVGHFSAYVGLGWAWGKGG